MEHTAALTWSDIAYRKELHDRFYNPSLYFSKKSDRLTTLVLQQCTTITELNRWVVHQESTDAFRTDVYLNRIKVLITDGMTKVLSIFSLYQHSFKQEVRDLSILDATSLLILQLNSMSQRALELDALSSVKPIISLVEAAEIAANAYLTLWLQYGGTIDSLQGEILAQLDSSEKRYPFYSKCNAELQGLLNTVYPPLSKSTYE